VQASIKGTTQLCCILSTFDKTDPIGGKITLESNHQMVFMQLNEEGHGLHKQVF